MFLCQRSLYLYYKFVPGSEVYIVRIFFDPRAMVQFCLFLDQTQTCPPSLVPCSLYFQSKSSQISSPSNKRISLPENVRVLFTLTFLVALSIVVI